MKNSVLYLFLIVIFFSSCGVITKARYGNGYKVNLELNWLSKHKNEEVVLKKRKIHKIKPLNSQQDTIESNIVLKEQKDSLITENKQFKPIEVKNYSLNKQSTKKNIKKTESFGFNKQQKTISKNKVKPNQDPRPIAPYLILALVLMFFFPYVSIYLATKSMRIIKDTNFAFKGYNLAIAIIILNIIIVILALFFMILIILWLA